MLCHFIRGFIAKLFGLQWLWRGDYNWMRSQIDCFMVTSARKSYAKFPLVRVYVYVCINLVCITLEGERGRERNRERERGREGGERERERGREGGRERERGREKGGRERELLVVE